eukprot:1105761-Pyramimonas_sp.AAC.1
MAPRTLSSTMALWTTAGTAPPPRPSQRWLPGVTSRGPGSLGPPQQGARKEVRVDKGGGRRQGAEGQCLPHRRGCPPLDPPPMIRGTTSQRGP